VTTRERHLVSRDYQMMVSALADVAKRRDAELAGAERGYQHSAAQAAGELARAEGEAASADRFAGAAAAAVLDVDREAARLWDELRMAPGIRARALGDVPDPAPVETLPRMALQRTPDAGETAGAQEPARALLARAAERIDGAVRRTPRQPLPRWVLPLLPPAGALVAAATGLLAAGLVTMGRAGVEPGALLRAVGWLAFLLAPSAGVPVAAYLAHRRLNARLDIGGIGLTLLGGMLAAAALSMTFATR
jgi:hypothetical protein